MATPLNVIKNNPEIQKKYDILRSINSGGTSIVYLAADKKLNKQWAIKQVKKEDSLTIQSLIKEASILKDLDHSALPRVVDIIDDVSYFYIVMDYVEGENLKMILKYEGAQPEDLVVSWGARICDVLDYLHSKNIIYRDMKPANVMLSPSGEIKLIDFGIAREYKESASEDTTALGTEGFAAPEQYEGFGQTDARTDIYSLGITLFQLLTNINPATYKSNSFDITAENGNLSSGLSKIILKATNKNPNLRYKSAKEMKVALLNYEQLDDEHIETRKNTIKKFSVLFITAIVFLLLALGSRVLDGATTNNKYNKLLDTPTPNNIEQAIYIKPEDARGYEALIDSYDGKISEKDASSFASVYGSNKDSLSPEDNVVVNMYAGEKLLVGYDEDSERGKLLAAYPYFKVVKDSGEKKFDKYNVAVCYCNMATLYKNYITQDDSLIVKEPSKEEYTKLLSSMNDATRLLDEYKGSESKHLKLSSYELMLGLINEERFTMREQKVNKEQILEVIDNIETRAKNVDARVKVTKEKQASVLSLSQDLKTSINLDYSKEGNV